MATPEQVIKNAHTLPPDEQRKLIEVVDRDLRNAIAADKYHQEIAWIEEHRDEYLGQWVALNGNRLLAHGTNAKEVAQDGQVARSACVEKQSSRATAFLVARSISRKGIKATQPFLKTLYAERGTIETKYAVGTPAEEIAAKMQAQRRQLRDDK